MKTHLFELEHFELKLTASCSCAPAQIISCCARESANTSDEIPLAAAHCTVCRCSL